MPLCGGHPRHQIVEKEARPKGELARLAPAIAWEEEANRVNQVGRRMEAQAFALAQGLEHEAHLALGQVAQTAVNQLGGMRRSRTGEVAAIDQGDAQPAHRGVTGDGCAVDASADYRQVEGLSAQAVELIGPRNIVGGGRVEVGGHRASSAEHQRGFHSMRVSYGARLWETCASLRESAHVG